jgi:hypothetical protein
MLLNVGALKEGRKEGRKEGGKEGRTFSVLKIQQICIL